MQRFFTFQVQQERNRDVHKKTAFRLLSAGCFLIFLRMKSFDFKWSGDLNIDLIVDPFFS